MFNLVSLDSRYKHPSVKNSYDCLVTGHNILTICKLGFFAMMIQEVQYTRCHPISRKVKERIYYFYS